MAFRGWWQIAGHELANTSRVVDHLSPGRPTEIPDPGFALDENPDDSLLFDTYPTPPDKQFDTYPGPLDQYNDLLFDPGDAVDPERDMAACSCSIEIPYDDSWPGLPVWLGHEGRYTVTDSPWYTPSIPASGEFVGVWVMAVDGLDSLPVSRSLSNVVGGGAVAGPSQALARPVRFDALVVGCTNAGARFGLSWLSRVLDPAGRTRRGVSMRYLDAHPSGTAEPVDALARELHQVVLTSAPEVRHTSGHGKVDHRQASIFRVEFELTALNPYVWGPVLDYVPEFDVVSVPVTWAHEPDCVDTGDCPSMPVLLSTDCAPVDVRVPPVPVPSCGGCTPLCDIERRTWVMPSEASPGADVAVSLIVENTSDEPLTATMYWRLPGSTDVCDEGFRLNITGLPVGGRIVADSTCGRVRAFVGEDEVRQVGIVTSSAGPWRPMVVDGDYVRELVVDTAPGTEVDVRVEVQERGR